jgi:hypothetical protein
MRRAFRLVVLAALLAAPARPALAENRWDTGVSYFTEPGGNVALHVIHPQTTLKVDAHKVLGFNFGYDVDIVTGATVRTYGAAADAISSATSFSDYRHSFHGGMQLRLGQSTLDAGYTYGFENDYRSHSVDASAKVDLWGKNTTFKLGYSHNFDSVCNVDNSGAAPLERRSLSSSDGCFSETPGLTTEPLAIDSYFASWTQVLHPIVLTDVSVSFQALDGFQSNPYRRVRLFSGTVEAQESQPLLRQRVAVQARMKLALKRIHAAVGVTGRFYWDTWNIKSGNVEVTYDQYLGSKFVVRLRGRFYQQGRALFYRDAGEMLSYEAVGPVGQYFTGDRELSPFRDWLIGFKISYLKSADEKGKIGKVFEALDLNLKFDLMAVEALTPLPPNAQRSWQAIDAAIVQLGLSLRW